MDYLLLALALLWLLTCLGISVWIYRDSKLLRRQLEEVRAQSNVPAALLSFLEGQVR